jgi:transposase
MRCMDRIVLEQMLEQGLSLAEIGRRVDRHESTVAYWVARHGLEANGRARHTARGALTRGELEARIERGMSIAEIAADVSRSKATIRHWLRKHRLRTFAASGRRRAIESRRARDAGLSEARMHCSKHGETMFVLDSRGHYRCRRCRSASVSRRRRRLKEQLVREAGGACRICGYSRCVSALEFHHLVPAEKSFSLSEEGVTRSLARARAEAGKCVLLCGNCHAEVEAGVVSPPTSIAAARLE